MKEARESNQAKKEIKVEDGKGKSTSCSPIAMRGSRVELGARLTVKRHFPFSPFFLSPHC
jgi:hypothetical protein